MNVQAEVKCPAPAGAAGGELPHVALFSRGDVFGGAEESLLFNACELMVRGFPVTVLCSKPGIVAERLTRAGLSVITLLAREQPHTGMVRRMVRRAALSAECRLKEPDSSFALRLAGVPSVFERRSMREALGRIRPSVFYANMSAAGDFHFLHLAHGMGLATLSHQRVTPPPWTGRRLVAEANRFCTQFIANSRWTRERWREAGLRDERHEIVYNTIPFPGAAKASLRTRLGLERSSRLVASVGRIEPTKRFELGLRAFLEAAPEFPDWHYVVMGEGPERANLAAEAARSACAARVHFLGEVPHAATYLGQVDLLFHPTLAEHFGRVVAEAMLHGTLVVGHAAGGVPEMIENGINGFLFADEREMSASLRTGLRAYADADMKKRARAGIEKLCGRGNSDRLADIIRSAATRVGTPTGC